MRGSSVIAICEVAGMGREITVRNVVLGVIAARPEGSPHLGAATGCGHPGTTEVVAVMPMGRHQHITLFS